MTLQLPREYWKRGRLLKMIEELEARIEYLEDKLMDASVDTHAQIDKREATIAQQKTELEWYEGQLCKRDALICDLQAVIDELKAELKESEARCLRLVNCLDASCFSEPHE